MGDSHNLKIWNICIVDWYIRMVTYQLNRLFVYTPLECLKLSLRSNKAIDFQWIIPPDQMCSRSESGVGTDCRKHTHLKGHGFRGLKWTNQVNNKSDHLSRTRVTACGAIAAWFSKDLRWVWVYFSYLLNFQQQHWSSRSLLGLIYDGRSPMKHDGPQSSRTVRKSLFQAECNPANLANRLQPT